MANDTKKSEDSMTTVGHELADWATQAVDIWKRDRLEPSKLHFLDVLQRRLKTIDDDGLDRRVNAVAEVETCLEQWTERRDGLLVEARKALQPLYEKLEPLFGAEGIDQLILNRLHLVSEDLRVQAYKMMFREIGHEIGEE